MGATLDRLTPRQREVLALIAQGLPNREIARRLFVEARTVERHIHEIFAVLGIDGEQGSGRVLATLIYLRATGMQDGVVCRCPHRHEN